MRRVHTLRRGREGGSKITERKGKRQPKRHVMVDWEKRVQKTQRAHPGHKAAVLGVRCKGTSRWPRLSIQVVASGVAIASGGGFRGRLQGMVATRRG